MPLQWHHNGRNDVSNHRRLDCLVNRLFRHRSKKTSNLRVTGLCEGNPPVTGGFNAQRASNTENVSIWWRHQVVECNNSLGTRLCEIYLHLSCIYTRAFVANTSLFTDKSSHGLSHLPLNKNVRHSIYDIFKCIFMNLKFCILNQISMKLDAWVQWTISQCWFR